jgi:sugar phosphate isomerase/epimerase
MDFGLSTRAFTSERLNSHILDQICGAGIRQIEIFAARQHLNYGDPNQVRDVGQWFADHEIALHSVHAPLFGESDRGRLGDLALSLAYLEKRLRIDSMDEVKRALEIAERLPFKYLVLHLGVPEEEFDLRKFDAAFTSLEHLRVFAKELGVQILLENIPNELSTPERLLQFIHYTRLDFKICFDTGHAHLTGGVHPAFETLKDRVACVHLHDNHGEKDEHLPPFEGQIDWQQTLRDFRAFPGDGHFPILFELRDDGQKGNRVTRVREAIRKLESVKD